MDDKENIDNINKAVSELKVVVKDLQTAFPKDDENNPDYLGHRLYHKKERETRREIEKSRAMITRSILAWLAIGALTIIGSSLMQALLQYISNSPISPK